MKPYEGKENYIFVSYAHKDVDVVLPILDILSGWGYRIWYDDGIVPGNEWPQYIAEHLIKSALVIAFLSPNYINSQNCVREISFALARSKRYLEVDLCETVKPDGLDMQLSVQRCVLRTNYPSDERFLWEICSAAGMDECGGSYHRGSTGHIPNVPPQPRPKSRLPLVLGIAGGLAAVAVIAVLLLHARTPAQDKSLGGTSSAAETAVITQAPESTEAPALTAAPVVTAVPAETAAPEPTAEPTLEVTPEPAAQSTPEASQEPEAVPDVFAAAEVGDVVTFGSYEQDNDTADGTEPIEWLVLDKTDSAVLVISRKALDCRQFNKEYEDVSWEACTLRSWLNNEFYPAAFSEEEQSRIALTTVAADINQDYYTYSGAATEDRVFLLSIKEAETYFADNAARQCEPTAYAEAQGVFVNTEENGKGCTWWWLRTMGSGNLLAAGVHATGSIRTDGNNVQNVNSAVRPAMWVQY